MRNPGFVTKATALSVFIWISSLTGALSIALMTKICETSKKLKLQHLFLGWLIVCFSPPSTHAVLLNDWVFNIDGTISENLYGDPIPTTGTLDDGLGALSLEITGAGAHNVIGFFDFEVDQNSNTYFNEYGLVTGSPAAGQSWEIDEPGWVFGDIVMYNVYDGVLDNTNAVPIGTQSDVSFAIGWNFSLLPDDVAVIDYVFSDILPTAEFFLTQVDPNSGSEFYFYSGLSIQTSGGPPGPTPTPSPIPEPGTAILFLTGLLLLRLKK